MGAATGIRLARAAWVALAFAGAPGEASAGPPQQHYVLHCQGCHGPEGRGARGAVSPLADQMGRFLQVPGGRAYLVQVPGAAQAPLSDAELAAVLNWMLEAFSPELIAEGFRPFEASEVSRYRGERIADAAALRRELLARLAGAVEAPAPPAGP